MLAHLIFCWSFSGASLPDILTHQTLVAQWKIYQVLLLHNIPLISSNPALFELLPYLNSLERPNKANAPDALFMLQLSLELIKLIVTPYKLCSAFLQQQSVDSK